MLMRSVYPERTDVDARLEISWKHACKQFPINYRWLSWILLVMVHKQLSLHNVKPLSELLTHTFLARNCESFITEGIYSTSAADTGGRTMHVIRTWYMRVELRLLEFFYLYLYISFLFWLSYWNLEVGTSFTKIWHVWYCTCYYWISYMHKKKINTCLGRLAACVQAKVCRRNVSVLSLKKKKERRRVSSIHQP